MVGLCFGYHCLRPDARLVAAVLLSLLNHPSAIESLKDGMVSQAFFAVHACFQQHLQDTAWELEFELQDIDWPEYAERDADGNIIEDPPLPDGFLTLV